MSRLNVIATAHPSDRGRLLVSATDDNGVGVPLAAGNVSVLLWASDWPTEPVVSVPVSAVSAVVDAVVAPSSGLQSFLEVKLGNVDVETPESSHPAPVASLGPHVYAIAVDRVDRGRTTVEHHGVAIVKM